MLKPWWECCVLPLHCGDTVHQLHQGRQHWRHFAWKGLWSCPDFPCLKGPQVTLKRPDSHKQHNNKFTFNFWPHTWRFLVVSERNALVPPFLKTAENSYFKCLREKTSSLRFPQIGGSTQEINPKKEVGHQATCQLPSWWICSRALAQFQIFLFIGLTELVAFLVASSAIHFFKISRNVLSNHRLSRVLYPIALKNVTAPSQLPSDLSPFLWTQLRIFSFWRPTVKAAHNIGNPVNLHVALTSGVGFWPF